MDNSGLGGGFLSGPNNGGLLDLEPSITRHQQTQLGHLSLTHPHQMNMMGGGVENDHRHIGITEAKGLNPQGFSMNFGKGKTVCHMNSTNDGSISEEDDTEDGNGENSGKKGSMWHRMKWTDDVVRLLISVVAFVGDDGMIDGMGGGLKRKAGILQKKGKWKTVSKVMISKGCQVSPQQCEDKFNDLNKRYKRLNDVLGRGISCQVVENPALMDSMENLSAKAKDDVRKILSSKHLFYKEMCAYHNGQRIPNCHESQDVDIQGCSEPHGRCSKDINGSEEEEADRNNDTDDDDSDNEDDHNDDGDEERMGELGEMKKRSKDNGHFWSQSTGLEGFRKEMNRIFQDSSKSPWEKREWVKRQAFQIQEERVFIQAQAYKIEEQDLKWKRYRSKKDSELERSRLELESRMLDMERQLLNLKQKKMEIDFRRTEHP